MKCTDCKNYSWTKQICVKSGKKVNKGLIADGCPLFEKGVGGNARG